MQDGDWWFVRERIQMLDTAGSFGWMSELGRVGRVGCCSRSQVPENSLALVPSTARWLKSGVSSGTRCFPPQRMCGGHPQVRKEGPEQEQNRDPRQRDARVGTEGFTGGALPLETTSSWILQLFPPRFPGGRHWVSSDPSGQGPGKRGHGAVSGWPRDLLWTAFRGRMSQHSAGCPAGSPGGAEGHSGAVLAPGDGAWMVL